MLPSKGFVVSTKKLTPKLAVKLFCVMLRTEAVVECRVKAGVRGMKNKAIVNVMNKIIHSPTNANKVVVVVVVVAAVVARFDVVESSRGWCRGGDDDDSFL